jgi:polyisoprenoid-binding protein YceI
MSDIPMASNRFTRCIAVLLAIGCAQTALAAGFAFDQRSSQLEFIGEYDGEPINGQFRRFSGQVIMDAKSPLSPGFKVDIDVSSLETDYADRDDVLKSPEWFDARQFPKASFEAPACKLVSTASAGSGGTANRAQCAGKLVLRGIKKPVTIEISVTNDGKRISGTAQLSRSDFQIGSGEWQDAGVIGETVKVSFSVNAL